MSGKCQVHGCELRELFTSTWCPECERMATSRAAEAERMARLYVDPEWVAACDARPTGYPTDANGSPVSTWHAMQDALGADAGVMTTADYAARQHARAAQAERKKRLSASIAKLIRELPSGRS